MDEYEKSEEQVEDLEPTREEAEDVKGGGGITAMDDWESPVAARSTGASPQLGRGGTEHQHNETLVVI